MATYGAIITMITVITVNNYVNCDYYVYYNYCAITAPLLIKNNIMARGQNKN